MREYTTHVYRAHSKHERKKNNSPLTAVAKLLLKVLPEIDAVEPSMQMAPPCIKKEK